MFTQFRIYLHIRELEIIKEFFRLYKTEVTNKVTISVEIYNYYVLNKNVILYITKKFFGRHY